MLARIRKSMQEKDQGFTLIELLVVMIIIGILAAIAIPTFLNQRAKARDTAGKSDVSVLGKELATYFVDETAQPAITVDAAGNYELTGFGDIGRKSDNVTFGGITPTTGATSTNWCVFVTVTDGTEPAFQYSAAGGLAPGDCTP